MQRPSAARLRRCIEVWLRRKNMDRDTRTYLRTEWEARGEPFGVGAALTLVTESPGPFYRVWNAPEGRGDIWTIGDFGKLLHDLGYRYEQGWPWSWHFYPAEAVQKGHGAAASS